MCGKAENISKRLVDCHVKHIRDAVSLEVNLQGFAVKTAAMAYIAGHVNIRQELHLDTQFALALAGLAAPAVHVE